MKTKIDRVAGHAKQSLRTDTKAARTTEIETVKMPANNPAMQEMSEFLANAYKQIIGRDLQAALNKKLEEFLG